MKEITNVLSDLWVSLKNSKTKGLSGEREGNLELQQGLLSPRTPA